MIEEAAGLLPDLVDQNAGWAGFATPQRAEQRREPEAGRVEVVAESLLEPPRTSTEENPIPDWSDSERRSFPPGGRPSFRSAISLPEDRC